MFFLNICWACLYSMCWSVSGKWREIIYQHFCSLVWSSACEKLGETFCFCNHCWKMKCWSKWHIKLSCKTTNWKIFSYFYRTFFHQRKLQNSLKYLPCAILDFTGSWKKISGLRYMGGIVYLKEHTKELPSKISNGLSGKHLEILPLISIRTLMSRIVNRVACKTLFLYTCGAK